MEQYDASLVFDLDGTLIDSVYQHVMAWSEALRKSKIELSIWRIHRRIDPLQLLGHLDELGLRIST